MTNIYRTALVNLFPNPSALRPEDQLIALFLDLLADCEDRDPQPSTTDCDYSEILVRCSKHRGSVAYRALAQKLSPRLQYKALMT